MKRTIQIIIITFLFLSCSREWSNPLSPDEDNNNLISKEVLDLLFLKSGNPSDWTVPNGVYSSYEEIRNWKESGFNVTTMDFGTIDFPASFLKNYSVLRIITGSGGWPDSECEIVYTWVLNGGSLFIDISAAPITMIDRFWVKDIEGSHGGSSGLSWIYHGAPWVFGPVNGPFQKVSSMAAQAMDHPVLKADHKLTIDASVSSYPIIVHGEFGKGKVIIVFAQGWSHDKTRSGNAYRATIFQKDNLQFLKNCINYLKN